MEWAAQNPAALIAIVVAVLGSIGTTVTVMNARHTSKDQIDLGHDQLIVTKDQLATQVEAQVTARMTEYRAQVESGLKMYQSLLAEMTTSRDNYKNMMAVTLPRLEEAAAIVRKENGLPAVAPLAAVIPEHNSPVTPAQEDAAELATMRARLAAVELGMNLGEEPPKEALEYAPKIPLPTADSILAAPPAQASLSPDQQSAGGAAPETAHTGGHGSVGNAAEEVRDINRTAEFIHNAADKIVEASVQVNNAADEQKRVSKSDDAGQREAR